MSESGRVHIYCRVSSAGQEDGYSLDTQEAACRKWAQERNMVIASVAREVWSGADRHRPELDSLLEILLSGDVVLSHALDRVSRSQVDTAILIDRIEAAGAVLRLVTEDFEQTATGVFLRSAKSFVAELEREKIAERTSRGRRARIASGKPIVSARPPFGYLWNPDKSGYVLDPETAPVVRTMYDLALSGMSLRGIAGTLEERGITSPTGRPTWTPPGVRHVLTRPVYAGDGVAFSIRSERQANGKYRRRPGTHDERVVLPGIAPPIISHEEQAAVLARLATNKAQSTRNNRDPESALLRAGFIVCAHCGWAMGVNNPAPSSHPRSAVYRCCARGFYCQRPCIATNVIDAAVWAMVCEVLRDARIIADEVERHRNDGGLERDFDAAEARLAALSAKQGRIAKAIAAVDDDSAAEPLLEELKNLAGAKAGTERELGDLRRRIADTSADSARMRSLADWCDTVAANLESLTYDERRMALDALGVQVRVRKEDAVDENGEKLPRWEMTMRPAPANDGFLYHPTITTSTPPRSAPGARRMVSEGASPEAGS